MQELFDRACPTKAESDRVARVVQQSHPRFRLYLHGRTYETLEHLARDARGIPETLLAELQYRPPPPPEEALEPSCAWSAPGPRRGPTQRQPQEYGAVLPPPCAGPLRLRATGARVGPQWPGPPATCLAGWIPTTAG
ncbi:unnamed protein product [Ixodes hexagonus]